MRISGGKRLRLRTPTIPGSHRPSMERMRIAFFHILGDIEGCRFLDLFSGSGIMALEAESRGADVQLVEKNSRAVHALRKFLREQKIHLPIYKGPVEAYIKKDNRPFDIIYCDPPFAYRQKNRLLDSLAHSHSVNTKSFLIIHHPSSESLASQYWVKQRTRKFGGSVLSFFRILDSTLDDYTMNTWKKPQSLT